MKTLTVYYTSDIHGYVYGNADSSNGLLDCFAQIQKDGNTLLMDGGDNLQGSPLASYLHNENDPRFLADMMNRYGYDVITLGNHDFNYGLDYQKRYLDATYKTEDPNSEGTIDLVRANLQLHDPLVTILPHKQPGLFRKVSINSTQEKAVLPLKQNGVLSQKDFASKYGGYNDLTAPFFMLVKSEGKKGKHIYSLENIPAVFQEKASDERFVMDYLTKNEIGPKLKNPVIILPKVLIKSVIELHPDENDKSKAVRIAINGKTGPSFVACNLSQLWLPEEMIKYVKAISVLLGNGLPKGERADLSKYANSYGPITFKGFKLTREENNKFFDYLCDDVFKRPCFALLSGIKTTICDVKTNRSLFDDLPTIQQEQLLNELVKILQKNNSGANLTYLSRQLVPNSGKIVLGKSIPANTLFIAQSVTGFYEKVLFQVPED